MPQLAVTKTSYKSPQRSGRVGWLVALQRAWKAIMGGQVGHMLGAEHRDRVLQGMRLHQFHAPWAGLDAQYEHTATRPHGQRGGQRDRRACGEPQGPWVVSGTPTRGPSLDVVCWLKEFESYLLLLTWRLLPTPNSSFHHRRPQPAQHCPPPPSLSPQQ